MQIHDITWGIGALLCVLGLIWLVQKGVRSHGLIGGSATGRLRLVQSLAIDPKRRVVLVECDGNQVLLLVGGTTDLVLPLPQVPGPKE